MKKFILIGTLVCMAQVGWAEDPCKSSINDCSYYSCRENVQHCGEQGYFSRLAYPYCDQLTHELRPSLSEEGKKWLDLASQCLRNFVSEMPLDTSCHAVETEAVKSHYSCYVDSGYCELPFGD